MLQKYFDEFMDRFSYPDDAKAVLRDNFNKLSKNTEAYPVFLGFLETYKNDMNCDLKGIHISMKDVSIKADIHEYTGNLILFICLSMYLKEYYAKAGLSEELWYNAMCDLRYKLIECKEVYNIWGSFVPDWFVRFFKLDRFAFGKLQFEPVYFKANYKKGDIVLEEESTVLNVHIPRTGTKLDRQSMKEAYAAAAKFYGYKFEGKPIVFVCHSWLLFPRNKEILSENSNLYQFISDFDVFESGEYDDYKEVWRLFDTNYDGNVDHLPQNTSFRRGYADWIRKGIKTGWGYGVYVYEG
jgi:hypothetical protein